MYEKKKIIIAVTGASGSVYANDLILNLQKLEDQISEVVLIFSEQGKQVWDFELKNESRLNLPFKQVEDVDFFSASASGSAAFDCMIICPCSMGTIGRIAHGISDTLITRAADVMLKERKKLILAPREMPYNLIHLRNMVAVTEAGGIICPASPSFYHHPQNIQEAINTVTEKILLLAGFSFPHKQWGV